MAIRQLSDNTTDTTSLVKKISLSSIKLCSNLNVSFFAKTENLDRGRLDLQLSYPSFDENDNVVATCTHPFTIRETDSFKKFNFDLICVPGGRKEFDLRLTVHANTTATVYIDDIELIVWD